MEITFKIAKNFKQMKIAYQLISNHYQAMKLDPKNYQKIIEEMIDRSQYQMLLAFNPQTQELIGVCGFSIARLFYCGRFLQVSNLIVDEKNRSKGIGKKILNHLYEIANENDCDKIVLDSYTENKRSQAIYFSEGFYIRAFHFVKDL
jgi:ribosomal protein S18 acetylase RimI-like enzyme